MAVTVDVDAGARWAPALRALGDERLAKMVEGGSDPAFAAIYGRYAPVLHGYCRSILHDDEEAGDALQNAMLKALQAMRRAARTGPLRPWLFRIAHNESITIVRQRTRRPEELPEDVAGRDDAFRLAVAREQLATLLADLGALTTYQRSALVMRELGGLSYDEIAGALDTTPLAARQAVFAAKRRLDPDGRFSGRRLKVLLPPVPAGFALFSMLAGGGGAAAGGAAGGLAAGSGAIAGGAAGGGAAAGLAAGGSASVAGGAIAGGATGVVASAAPKGVAVALAAAIGLGVGGVEIAERRPAGAPGPAVADARAAPGRDRAATPSPVRRRDAARTRSAVRPRDPGRAADADARATAPPPDPTAEPATGHARDDAVFVLASAPQRDARRPRTALDRSAARGPAVPDAGTGPGAGQERPDAAPEGVDGFRTRPQGGPEGIRGDITAFQGGKRNHDGFGGAAGMPDTASPVDRPQYR